MRTYRPLLVFSTAISLLSGCGGATPTGPSAINVEASTPPGTAAVGQEVPSLDGKWRASGKTIFRNLDNGNTIEWGNCSGVFTITQDGQRFSGPVNMQGGSWNSDRFCTASGTFTGELVDGDRSAVARLEGNFQNWPRPSVLPLCEMIEAGDGIWSGGASADSIRLEIRDTLRCAANVEGGTPGLPMARFQRTVSLAFERW